MDRLVPEAVHLGDVEHAAAQPSEHRPPAFGAQIEGEKPRGHSLTASETHEPIAAVVDLLEGNTRDLLEIIEGLAGS